MNVIFFENNDVAGRRQQVGVNETHFEAYERGTGEVSSDTTPEPVCK